MGTRGPQRDSTTALKMRGSRRGKAREKAEREEARPAKRVPLPEGPPRPGLPRTKVQWEKLLRELPGYDPFVGSETDYYFSPRLARAKIDYIETRCRHAKGDKAREPFILERWERALFANALGWLTRTCSKCGGSTDEARNCCLSCGRRAARRYREVGLFIPRKNGKTPIDAIFIKLALFTDNEYGAEVYGAASTYKQALFVFNHVRAFVRLDDEIGEEAQIYKGQSAGIQLAEDTGWSAYRVVAADAEPVHGWLAYCVILDELHVFPDGQLVEAAETSFGGRDQPLLVWSTTSDFERPDSVCNSKQDYANQVRKDPTYDLAFLPCIYETKLDADWHDREVWKATNPNLGVSLSWEYMERAYKKACRDPAEENSFKRLHLNIRTAQDVRLITKEKWDLCAGEPFTLADFAGQECWGGLDLATTQDLIAWVLAFKRDGLIYLMPTMWLPRQTADERERKAGIPYTRWAREGHIRLTDGGVADYAVIRRDIVATIAEHKLQLQDIAADRVFQGSQICQELNEGDGLPVSAHGQGFLDYAAPMKAFMELYLGAKLRHGGHPVLAWHASNVMAEMNAPGDLKPSRKTSKEKIDGFVAAVMAVGRAMADTGKRAEAPTVMILE